MDTPTLFKHWNNLPNEIKIKIVKNLDLSSRLALRSCSVDDWKLVESVPFRKIHWLRLAERKNHEYHILLVENYYNEAQHLFENFEEFQEKILKILDNVDYIKKLDIRLEKNLKLMPRNRKIEIKKLLFNIPRPEFCLQQVDATTLKKLIFEFFEDQVLEFSDELWNSPQFNSVDELEIFGSNIRNDQLIQLKSKNITLSSCGKITPSGIYNFIKTRTSDPNFEKLRISGLFDDLHGTVINDVFGCDSSGPKKFIHPSFPEFETDIGGFEEIKMRRIRTSSTAISKFKKVNRVVIAVDSRPVSYTLRIEKNRDDIIRLSRRTHKKLQKVLTETMANIDYIKHLEVGLPSGTRCWRFVPEGNSKQITVGYLKTYSDEPHGQLFFDLLKQIEPGHLKYVDLGSYLMNIRNDIYDMQQLIQAEYIVSRNCNVQDYQLMRFSATKMDFGEDPDSETSPKITASGANKFIKKCLLDLKNREYDFQLVLTYQSKEYQEFICILLEGLDIFSMKNDQKILEEFYPSEVIVNSNWKGIKLKLVIKRQYLKGERIEE